LDLGVCRYAGKGQGELSVFRRLMGFFRPGDVVLTDRLYCTWRELLTLQERGVHAVSQLQVMRKADFRKGQRLGKGDHLVEWPKPSTIRSVDWPTYRDLPDTITVRECRVVIGQAGFRNKSIVVVTTLLDPDEFTRDDLAALYRARWNAELDLRSVKTTMQMEVLRCKTPELVRKEIWTHVLAYNLIRTVMAQAASEHALQPRSISFKGAMQTLEAFRPVIACCSRLRHEAYERLLDCIAAHAVGDRPGRFEPRQVKRRPKRFQWMMLPRHETKLQLLKELR
ncbi:transposase, partial [Botrimarina hoheduenensis]